MEIKFVFENIEIIEGKKLEVFWQYLINIETNLLIFLDDELFYLGEYFTLIEFSRELALWKDDGFKKRQNFIFHPIDSDHLSFLWFEYKDGGWLIGSEFQEFECKFKFETEYLQETIDNFLQSVISRCKSELGMNVSKIIYTKNVGFSEKMELPKE